MHQKLTSESYTWTYSECGNEASVYGADSASGTQGITMPPSFPPRVVRGKDDRSSLPCCAGCALNAADIRLYYFKDQRALDYCSSHTRQLVVSNGALDAGQGYVQKPQNITSLMFLNFTEPILLQVETDFVPDTSIAVVSGHTL